MSAYIAYHALTVRLHRKWIATPDPTSSKPVYSLYNVQSGQYLVVSGGNVKGGSAPTWWDVVRDDEVKNPIFMEITAVLIYSSVVAIYPQRWREESPC